MGGVINIGRMLSNRAFLSPWMEACVGENYRYNFEQVNERANKFAAFLKSSGISEGDRIAVLCKNNEHVTTSIFGAAKIGVITVTLNWRLQIPELTYILSDCGASLVVYDDEFKTTVNQLRSMIPAKSFLSVGGAGSDVDFESALAGMPSAEPDIVSGGDDPAVIMYTSGTTGKPKGAMLTHNNLFWASIGLAHTIDWAYGYRFLCVAPLFHIGGLAPIMGNVHSGCTSVYMPNFDPFKIWDVITSEKINFLMTVPMMLQYMLMVPNIAQMDLSSIRYIVCGGSAVPPGLIATYYNKLGLKITHVYGITEYSGAVTFWTYDMGSAMSDSMGKPVFHGDVKIYSPESDEELPPGEVGEICCFGPQVFKGYWNNPVATDDVLRDEFYRSGDLGRKDEKGFLYVVDRLKDMIVSGSENIYPAELESVIIAHPGVTEVAVIGKPDERWGEIPAAFVVKKPDADVTEQDIMDICKENLAGYKCVKEVRFVEAIPKNAVGKVLKNELKEQVG